MITINQEQRVAEAKRKAVIEAQPAIRAYMDERRFDDPDFIRAVIVEFVKLSAAMSVKVESEMLECVSGKRPMPDADKLREWAATLGVPAEWLARRK